MSIELTERTNAQDAQESRDTLFLLGGAAMVVFGAGLILSTPVVRRFLGGVAASVAKSEKSATPAPRKKGSACMSSVPRSA